MISQIIVSQAPSPLPPASPGQPVPEHAQAGADAHQSVNAMFACITSGRAEPDDFARYVDLWDKLQAAQWRRRPKTP